MAYKLQLKRGSSGSLPTGSAGEPLFTTDTNDLYIGTGAANQRYQKYIASGSSSQFLKGDGSLDSNTYYLASNPSAYIALTALTASSPLSYNNTTGAFTIAQASGSANGFLSSTDWTTFNNKQNALTNPVTGTGTTNYLPKWTSGSALGNSLAQDTGSSINVGTATTYPATKLVVGGSSANGGIVSEDTASTGSFVRILGDVSSGNLINYKNGTSLRFASSAADFTSFAEQMRLTSTGLGIGTTSPATKVDISYADNTYAAGLTVTNTTNNTQAQSKINIVNSAGTVLSLMSQSPSVNGGAAFVTTSNTTPLVFGVNYLEKMRLDNAGNLGLGVVPSAWGASTIGFDIGAWSSFAGVGGSTFMGFNSYSTSTSAFAYKNTGAIAIGYQQTTAGHQWYIAPSGTAGNAITFTQAMTLDASGRLGIGVTSPTGELHIFGSQPAFRIQSSVSGNMQFGQWDTTTNRIQSSGRNFYLVGTDAYDTIFATNNTERLRITSGGNVGIGTTSPVYKMHIVNSGNTLLQLNGNNTAGTLDTGFTISADDSKNIYLYQRENAAAIFATNNTERLRITSGGNVGIGRSAPDYLLEVNDSIKSFGSFVSDGNGSVAANFYATGQIVSGASDQPSLYLDTTWNTTGNARGIEFNVNNTSSGASSKLLNLKVDFVSKFIVYKDGKINASGLPTSASGLSSGDIWNDGGTLKIV